MSSHHSRLVPIDSRRFVAARPSGGAALRYSLVAGLWSLIASRYCPKQPRAVVADALGKDPNDCALPEDVDDGLERIFVPRFQRQIVGFSIDRDRAGGFQEPGNLPITEQRRFRQKSNGATDAATNIGSSNEFGWLATKRTGPARMADPVYRAL